MTTELLHKLKQLQCVRSDISPFMDYLEFQQWADDVTPLLYFDSKLQNQFKQCVRAATISKSLDTTDGINSNIGRAIGIVNQAVTSLERNPVQNSAANPAEPKPVKPNNKSSISVLKIAEAVIGTVVAACIFFLIANHFGLKLN